MRLKVSVALANENLIALINRGYAVLDTIKQDYANKKETKSYNGDIDNPKYEYQINQWGDEVVNGLTSIFPTELERNLFLNPEIPFGTVSGDYKYQSMVLRFKHFIRGLEAIRQNSLSQYTDLPMQDRLYVEDIDSFQKVRDINPAMVAGFLENGFLSWTEDQVQIALEQILGVPFHKKDWGGELNDLYTANVIVNSSPRATGFLLKGPGIGKKEMVIADCGKNGDQLVRLFTTPADLFVVQYVGLISEMLIMDVQGKVTALKSKGKTTHFLIIDGQDTARLLHAYGKL
ncbi:hypothetical protein ACFLVG_03680 [Chloroflexota bacterium]